MLQILALKTDQTLEKGKEIQNVTRFNESKYIHKELHKMEFRH